MALSDDERRVLAQIERDLVADDPRFAKSIARRRLGLPWFAWAFGGFLGPCCVVIGLVIAGGIGTAVAVVGFVLIIASCAVALRARRPRRSWPPRDTAA